MSSTARFALVMALCAVSAVAATVAAIGWSRSDDGLGVSELARVESLPPAGRSPLDDHLRFSFEILGRDRVWTDDALDARFTEQFRETLSAAELNSGFHELFTEVGPVTFVRVQDRASVGDGEGVEALAVAADGTPFELTVVTDGADRVETWGISALLGRSRLAAWESSLTLLAGWLLVAASVWAWRSGRRSEAWLLAVGSLPTASVVLVLADSGLGYTAGRLLPAATVVVVVALLCAGRPWRRWTSIALGTAAVAALIALVAPLLRDPSAIGHPALLASLADDSIAYRSALVSAAVATIAALGLVAIDAVRALPRTGAGLRPATAAVAVVAGLGATAAVATAVGEGLGEPLVTAPAQAMALATVALVPGPTLLRVASQRWGHAELAALVIDLEAQGSDLQPAIARALDDPSLRLLTSPDGSHLVEPDGSAFRPGTIAPDEAITRIQSGPELVGALVHRRDLQSTSPRLEAVAAAAGMALQVSRLNRQVTTQLAESDASRVRILQASDEARRRVERDLHDGAQQRLVAIGIDLQRARRSARQGHHDGLDDLLDGVSREVRDTIDEIRAVTRGAQPALLAERGLAAAIDALAERAPVPVRLDIDAELPAETERTAYFVVAEALTNIAKHAHATRVAVSISRRDSAARIRIIDDGIGGAEPAAGSGLEGLTDRVATAGGRLRIISGPGGTELDATLPCR